MMSSSAGSALLIEKGVATGGGPSPRICGPAGPRCASRCAAVTRIRAIANVWDQEKGFFTVDLSRVVVDSEICPGPRSVRRAGDHHATKGEGLPAFETSWLFKVVLIQRRPQSGT